MTDWKQVRGTQTTRPLEVDTSSSTKTVYLRRNIEQVEIEDGQSEETVTMWEYEERQMTPEEYSQYLLVQESTNTITAFQKQPVIDDYTAELLEGGLI